jgi:origin recognition complex subunit 1
MASAIESVSHLASLNRKTACVRACINEVSQRETEDAGFDFFIVNGMELRNPDDAYTMMWEEVSPNSERCTSARAREELEAYFTCPSTNSKDGGGGKRGELERVVVVLFDEVDYLVTKKQRLLYDIFDWPVRAIHGRRLVVIAISNTVNLPERLHPRVQSRMTKRCFFKAYAEKEISDIVRAKVSQASPNYEVFTDDAIKFVSKKTAATTGDIRKAFFIFRVAAETILTEAETSDPQDLPRVRQVGINDVVQVSRDAFNSAQCKGVALLAPYEALLLVSLGCLCKWTGREHGGFDLDEILTKMKALANALGDPRYQPPPTLGEALEIVTRLGEARVVGLSTSTTCSTSYRPGVSSGGGPWPLVSMVMDDSAIFEALKKTENRELALKLMQVTD